MNSGVFLSVDTFVSTILSDGLFGDSLALKYEDRTVSAYTELMLRGDKSCKEDLLSSLISPRIYMYRWTRLRFYSFWVEA